MASQHDISGERQEFEAVALRHFDAVFSYAMTLTRNRDEAEDLTQETFYKAYRSWHQFQAGTYVKAWLLTISRNSYINRNRQARRRPIHIDIDDIEPIYAAPKLASNWESIGEWIQHEVHDEVKAALEQLPEFFLEVVFFAEVASCSYEEIADILGCPVGTVMSRLYRARRLLRQHLMDFVREHRYAQIASLSNATSCDEENQVNRLAEINGNGQ